MQFILERLAAPTGGFDMADAVRSQVQRLVAIHVWEGDTGLHLMNMSTPALADVTGPQALDRLAAHLHALIRQHEPRLDVSRVEVRPAGSNGASPSLLVVARLDDEVEPRTLQFELPRY
ncbi:hypothetical protein ACFJGW_17990 [Burkholderiaceae bacterium UC74_6]